MPEVRLIDANALMKRVCEKECGPHFNIDLCDLDDDSTDTRCVFREYVKAEPTIEAEPVRHGRWNGWTTSKFTGRYKDYDEPEFKDYKYYTCSECYRKSAIRELYCPSCGARMEVNEDAGTD